MPPRRPIFPIRERRLRRALGFVFLAGLLLAVAGALRAPRKARLVPTQPLVEVAEGAIGGSIRDERGAPIEADVELGLAPEEGPARTLRSARSGTTGNYVLDAALPPGEKGLLLLRVRAPGFAVTGRAVADGQRRYDFVLTKGMRDVVVRATDEDGVVVPAARVTLSVEPRSGASGSVVLFEGETNASGEATFAGISAASGVVHHAVRRAGRARGTAYGETELGEGTERVVVEARLDRGARLVGEVIDRDGRPVAGVDLRAGQVDGPWSDDARTNDRGAFALDGVPRGRISVMLDGDWILAASTETEYVELRSDERERRLRLTAEPAGSISGRVRGAQGPLAGVHVAASPVGTSGHPRAVASDADGKFTIRGLARTTKWNVEARASGLAPAFRENVVATSRDVELRLAAGGTLEGEVVDERASPATDVEVYAHRMEEHGTSSVALPEWRTTTTGPDGKYRLEHLGAGVYRVEARSRTRVVWSTDDARVARAEVREGESTTLAPLTWSRTGEIKGRLIGAVALPSMVDVAVTRGDGVGGNPYRARAALARDGSFSIDGLEAGTYAISARDADLGWASARGVVVRPGLASEAALAFEGREALEGTVVNAEGHPVEGALVDVYDASSPAQRDRSLPGRAPANTTGNVTRTAADGTFVVRGLGAGAYRVHVTKDGAPGAATDVSVPRSRLAVTLPRPAALEVELDAPTRPDRVVTIETLNGAGAVATATTDRDGRARFDALPPGTYRVRAIVAGIAAEDVHVAEGSRQRVVLRPR